MVRPARLTIFSVAESQPGGRTTGMAAVAERTLPQWAVGSDVGIIVEHFAASGDRAMS